MKYFKLIAKIFAILLVLSAIGLAALVWRVQQAPLDLKFLLSYWHTKDTVLQVDAVQLEKSAFYKLPQITIQNLRYTAPNLEIKCQNLRGYWRIWDILKGDLGLNNLILFKPTITVHLQNSTEKVTPAESLKILQHLPFANLTVTDGQLIIIPANTTIKPITITHLSLSIDHRSRLSNWELSGLLFNHISLKGSGHFQHRKLIANALIQLKNVKSQDFSAYTADVQEYLTIFGQEAWNLEAALHVNNKADLTVKWNLPSKPSHEFSTRLIQSPFQPLELTIKLPALSIANLKTHWPPSIAPEARIWILENIPHGNISSTEIICSLLPDTYQVQNLKVRAHLQNAQVKAWNRLPSFYVESAEAMVTDEKVSILLHKAKLEELLLENGKISLSNEMKDIQIHTVANGEAQSVLRILDTLKIDHPLITKSIKGNVDLNIGINLKIQDPLDLKLNIHGDLKNIAGGLKLLDQTFNFHHGEFHLDFSNELFALKGQTMLENRPIHITLRKENPLETKSVMTYEIHGQVDSKIARSFMPNWLHNTFKEGFIGLDLKSTLTPQQESILELDANLKMVALNIAPLGWEKLRNADATFQMEMRSKENMTSISKLQLESSTLNFNGTAHLMNGNIDNIDFNATVKKKQQLNISTKRNENGLTFTASGDFLDARPLLKYFSQAKPTAPKEDSKQPYQLLIDLRNIALENNVQIPALKADIIDNGTYFSRIEVSATTNKGGKIALTLMPKANKSELQVHTLKFDEFLRGLNLHEKVTIDKINLQATRPLKDPKKPYVGKVTVENIHVHNAPLIGRILSIMSLESLVSQLTGKGILFILGDAEFSFADKKLNIQRSAITSTALGLSFEGIVDFKNKKLNLEGAAVPVNVLNKMIGNIPLVGTMLTGGDKDKGVFSSSYKITGSFDNPDVKSNPLGVVVPNVIKKIFGGLTGTDAKPA